MSRRPYPTDLTDAEWDLVKPWVEKPPGGPGRPRTVDLRNIVDAVRYVLRAGCSWELVPHDFGPWATVWYYYRLWRDNGTFERLNTALRLKERERLGREPTPSAGSLDSQTVKTTEKGGPADMTRERK